MFNVRRKYEYTPDMVEIIKQRYPTEPSRNLAKDLNVSIGSLNLFAKKHLNLTKCPEYLKSLDGDFEKLQAGRAKTDYSKNGGWFKAGDKSWNRRETGDERVCSKDGFIKVKVSDRNWQPRAWLVWRKHNGKIPRGMVIWHKDGNNQNDDINNLELITRAEMMQRNSVHRYPNELIQVMRLNGRIKRRLENEQHK